VLRNISFTLITGHTKNHSRCQRIREVDDSQDHHRAAAGRNKGVIWVNRRARRSALRARDDGGSAPGPRHDLPGGGPLFRLPDGARERRPTSSTRRATCRWTRAHRRVEEVARLGSALAEYIDRMPSELVRAASGAVSRSAPRPWRSSRAFLLYGRGDYRPSIRSPANHGRRGDHQAPRPFEHVSSIVVNATSCATPSTSATHMGRARRRRHRPESCRATAGERNARRSSSWVRDGHDRLRRRRRRAGAPSTDPYIQNVLETEN